MNNKILRNTISAGIIVTMVVVSTILPVMFNGNTVSASGDAAKVTTEKGESSQLKQKRESRLNEKQVSSDNSLGIKANPSSNKIIIPGTVINNRASTFEFIGDGQYIVGGPDNIGVTCYVPYEYVVSLPGYAPSVGYFVDDNDDFYDPPYKIDITPYYMGKYTVKVTFVKFQWDGNDWNDLGTTNDHVKTVSFNTKGYVSFNKNKGKFKTSSASKLVTYGGKYGTLPKMKTRKGYTFAGWFTAKSAGKLIKSTSTVTIRKNTTLYAQWKYKITLNANKGKVSGKKTKTKTVTSGKKYGSLTTPKRSGNNFAGWYTKKSGGKWINKSKYNTNPSKHTLYAHWVKKSKYATKSQYKAVKVGMTYSEVKRIFGKAGKLGRSDGSLKGYVWLTKSGRNGAAVIFEKGKVTYKGWV